MIWEKVEGCPNFSQTENGDPRIRRGPYSVKCVVIHYTDGSLSSTLNTFLNRDNGVSAHLVIDHDGKAYEVLEPHYIAWHAGRSSWRGTEWCNSFSYGIELVSLNEAKLPDLKFTFTDAQYDTLHTVLWGGEVNSRGSSFNEPFTGLIERFKIDLSRPMGSPDAEVLGHEHVSPGRKFDPGPFFDWDRLHQKKLQPSVRPLRIDPEISVEKGLVKQTNLPPTRSQTSWWHRAQKFVRELVK